MPTLAEDREINRAARTDPNAMPLTAKQLAEMLPMRALRGRPRSASTKQLVSIRYSPKVLAYFRSLGEGWQSKIDGVLLNYVEKKTRKA